MSDEEDEGLSKRAEEEDDDDDDDGQKSSTKGGKKKKSKGGFHAMKLSDETLAGIRFLGFKQPTPIQRKAVPPALLGRDVVAMARTGSGKTAAFLIPMIEKLKAHSPETRCIVLSPTRELAQQTYKVGRSLAKRTDLRFCLLQGGDSLEAQFDALAACPDVLIATPGRLAHLLLEASDFTLNKVEMLVVDEADRLFELGFQVQLQEIVSRTPESRQTLLFSATMPKQLAEFARVKLREPELIRLDTEVRVSETLKLAFFKVRTAERPAALIHILRTLVDCRSQSTIVFCGTKHEVEFVGSLIRAANVVPTDPSKPSFSKWKKKAPRPRGGKHKSQDDNDDYEDDGVPFDHRGVGVAHGSMDQTARTQALEKFRSGEVKVFVVTDLAARGLDIPHVNNVINYDFPDKSKLFVHRVGRAARQGRVGTAFSLFATDEFGHLVDVMLYLGRSLEPENKDESIVGTIPQMYLDDGVEWVNQQVNGDPVLEQLSKTAQNAHKMYVKTRAEPSKRSVKRAKEIASLSVHPLFQSDDTDGVPSDQAGLRLEDISAFRPKKSTFEMEQSKSGGSNSSNRSAAKTAEFVRQIRLRSLLNAGKKKKSDPDVDEADDKDNADSISEDDENVPTIPNKKKPATGSNLTQEEGKHRLSAAERKRAKKRGLPVVSGTQLHADSNKKSKTAAPAPGAPTGAFRDEKYFVSNEASSGDKYDMEYESQLVINRLDDAVLDLVDDSDVAKTARSFQWDKRKKKYIQATAKDHVDAKRLKKGAEMMDIKNPGEAYDKWAKRTRKRIGGGQDTEEATTDVRKLARVRKEARASNNPFTSGGRRMKEELKNEEQIIKDRKEKLKKSERAKARKSPAKKRVKAGDDAKVMRVGKHKPKPGQYSRSKAIGGGGGRSRGGGKGRKGGR